MTDSIKFNGATGRQRIIQRGLEALSRGNLWSGIANLSTVAYADDIRIQELDDCVEDVHPSKRNEYSQIARDDLERARHILGTGGYYTDEEYLLLLTLIGPTVSAIRSIEWLCDPDVEGLALVVLGDLQQSINSCKRNRSSFQSACRMLRRNNQPLLRVIQKIGLAE